MTAPQMPKPAAHVLIAPAPFVRAYRRAVEKSGLSFADIARRAGLNPRAPERYAKGHLPGHETVIRLAEVLIAPKLVHMSLTYRMRTCSICGAKFMRSARRLFCSKTCQIAYGNRRRRQDREKDAVIVRHRLATIRAAVVAYCRGCEPEGVCRTAECDLRPVSPLPLARRAA